MIIPSIDIMDGQAVQLVGGRERALEAGDPMEVAKRFAIVGDLDATRRPPGEVDEGVAEHLGVRDVDVHAAANSLVRIAVGQAACQSSCDSDVSVRRGSPRFVRRGSLDPAETANNASLNGIRIKRKYQSSMTHARS